MLRRISLHDPNEKHAASHDEQAKANERFAE